jgi:hypothetical protein
VIDKIRAWMPVAVTPGKAVNSLEPSMRFVFGKGFIVAKKREKLVNAAYHEAGHAVMVYLCHVKFSYLALEPAPGCKISSAHVKFQNMDHLIYFDDDRFLRGLLGEGSRTDKQYFMKKRALFRRLLYVQFGGIAANEILIGNHDLRGGFQDINNALSIRS